MPEPLVIIGAGGHGREVLDVVRASNAAGASDYDVLGFLDDAQPDGARLTRIGARYVGLLEDASTLPAGTSFLIGIGSPTARRSVDERMLSAGLVAASVVHPRATLGGDVRMGEGVVIFAGAVLTTNIEVGRHVHVNLNATVAHDSVLGHRVTLNPGANISGNVTLEDDVTIGTCACVIQGVNVGRGATVGAGAAVVRSVEAGTVVKGVPARV